jgi:putative addiction module CopG family antidote
VESGDHASTSEVVRAGLRLLGEQDAERQARLEALRRDVGEGLAQLDRGEGHPGAEGFDQLRARRGHRSARRTGRSA